MRGSFFLCERFARDSPFGGNLTFVVHTSFLSHALQGITVEQFHSESSFGQFELATSRMSLCCKGCVRRKRCTYALLMSFALGA